MSDINLFGRQIIHPVRLCPVCGTTELRSDILVTAQQEPDGTWNVRLPDADDIQHEMTNVNVEVRCGNPHCGDATDASGNRVSLKEDETYFQFWARSKGYPSDVTFDALSEDERAEFTAWEGELYWTAWSGTISECQVL